MVRSITGIIVLWALLGTGAFGKTLVISDIDDTLKIAHVGSKFEAAKRAFRTDLHFSGMNELFHLVKRSGQVKFYYVSNAYEWIMEEFHEDFLKRWDFPKGKLYLNEGLPGTNHKAKTIRKILEKERAEEVIFLGDNAELDPRIYRDLAHDYPTIRMHQFIRQAYRVSAEDDFSPIFPGQVGFVTPVEIALALRYSGFLSAEAAALFTLEQQALVVEAEKVGMGPGYFPDWLNCGDFRWSAASHDPALAAYNQKISLLCGLGH